MRPAKNIEKLIRNAAIHSDSEVNQVVLRGLLKELSEAEEQKLALAEPNIRRTIMKSPIAKLAAAAVIIVAVWVGLDVIRPGGSVALAQVLAQIERIEAYTYKMKMNMANVPGMPTERSLNVEMKATVARDIGMRMTTRAGEGLMLISDTYVILDEKVIVSVMPGQKQYMRIKLTDDVFEKIRKENGDPWAIVRQFTENEYTKIGRIVVDGVEVEGFESNDPNIADNVLGNVVGRLWVDALTKLPVRFDIEVLGENGKTMTDMTVYGFEWDVAVEPDVFIPSIPDEYKLASEVELSTEEEFHLEVLGLFAELTHGKYPSELNVMKIMEEFQHAMITQFGDPMTEPSQPQGRQKMMNLQMASAFYAKLASQGKDLAYYGDKVTAEFPDAVLMRWKTEDGTYKVIFGDLSVGKAIAEELEELEAAPLNPKPTAIKPDPADGAEGTVLTGLKLSWMSGAYATAHRVYFGTESDQLTLLGEVTTESAEPATLQRGATYYWRIDEVQSDGSVVTGDLWSFNTGKLVAHWKLDEGAGNTISNAIGTGYNGKIIGNPIWTTGIIGGALEFDSDGYYVEIIDSNDFAVTRQITVSAWVKTDKIVRRWQAIATKGDRSWRLQGRRSGNALEFCCSGLLIPGNRWGSLYGKTDVDDGQWHHVAGVYDGERIYLYLDGKVDNSNRASGRIRLDDKQVRIGDNSQHPGRYWNGLIDDVRIYSYGMSAEEVAALSKE